MKPKIGPIYVEEVEFLRSCGISDLEVLTSLHVTASTLARALYREGRADLANPFARIDQKERHRKTCQTCGDTNVQLRSKTGLCHHCASRLSHTVKATK